MSYYEKTIGKKVIGFKKPFQQGDESITFLCENNEQFVLSCEGDCCSHSWFEHVELPELPFTIRTMEEIDGKEISNSEDEYEYIKTYGIKMVTDKGHVDIDMRNSSNGYYGGYFTFDAEDLK